MKNIIIFAYMYGNESACSYSLDAKKMATYITKNTDVHVDVVTGWCRNNDVDRKENVILVTKRHEKLKALEKKRKKLKECLKSRNIIKKLFSWSLLKFFYNIKHQKILKYQIPGYDVYNFSDKEIKKLCKKQ